MPRKTKKQLQQETIDMLVTELFRAVGLCMSNNYIFDQDMNLPWKFKNKFVKYKTTIVHNNEVLFDPILSKHMMRDIFNMAVAKAAQFDGLYIKSICPVFKPNGKSIQIFLADGIISSRSYSNEILAYYDICFELSCCNTPELIEALRYADTFIQDYYPKKSKGKKVI